MPETDTERRERQAAIEQAARARLHGVEMPKRLDFTSKKLHYELVLQDFSKVDCKRCGHKHGPQTVPRLQERMQ